MSIIFSRVALLLLGIVATMPGNLGMAGGPSQREIDAAIDSGVKFLAQQLADGKIADKSARAFVAYALSHCGVKPDDPALKPVVDEILADQLKGTYHAAICILTLSYFDPDNDKYRERIAECAQYLVGAQTPDGQWSYELGQKAERGSSGKIYTGKKSVKGDIYINPPAAFLANTKLANNSTTQYALLGLHAATKARVYAPKETWTLSYDYWVKSQNGDGGWGYASRFESGGTQAGGGNATSPYSATWFDAGHQKYDYASSYGNMTCAAIAGLAIAKANLGKDYKKEKAFKNGMKWLAANFSVDKVPGKVIDELVAKNKIPHYYYFYSLERACAIAECDKVGSRDWYEEGADFLLKEQGKEGGWNSPDHLAPHSTTAYALLFLKRASIGIIETGTIKKP